MNVGDERSQSPWMKDLPAIDPAGLCNPKKLFPTGSACVEVGPQRRQVAL